MVLTKIHILPILVFILIPASFLVTYCIAVSLNHVEIGFPYISDTGTYVPESCIFSQFVNLIAALLAATMYFRFKLVEQHCRDHLSSESSTVLKINVISLVIGLLGCLGVSIVGNFQETSLVIVHIIASIIAFGCGSLYTWLQTVISHYVCPLLNSLFVLRIRCILSLMLSAAFVSTIVAGVLAHRKFHGTDATKWHPSDGGFVEHVISTASEWIVVLCFDLYILTYAKEMKKISVSSPQVHFIIEDRDLNNEYFQNDDRVNIIHSHSSLKITSVPSSPYGELGGGESVLITQAVVH